MRQEGWNGRSRTRGNFDHPTQINSHSIRISANNEADVKPIEEPCSRLHKSECLFCQAFCHSPKRMVGDPAELRKFSTRIGSCAICLIVRISKKQIVCREWPFGTRRPYLWDQIRSEQQRFILVYGRLECSSFGMLRMPINNNCLLSSIKFIQSIQGCFKQWVGGHFPTT